MQSDHLLSAWEDFLESKLDDEELISEFDDSVQGRGPEYEISEEDIDYMMGTLQAMRDVLSGPITPWRDESPMGLEEKRTLTESGKMIPGEDVEPGMIGIAYTGQMGEVIAVSDSWEDISRFDTVGLDIEDFADAEYFVAVFGDAFPDTVVYAYGDDGFYCPAQGSGSYEPPISTSVNRRGY